jgi:hypothetical protein
MAQYELGINTTVTTTGAAAAELRAASGTPVRLRELGLTLAAATASTYGIGRPAAVGVTPTSPKTVLASNPSDPTGTATTAVAWGTGPTVPTEQLRRITLPATIGAGAIFTWELNRFIIGPGNASAAVASIVVWNLATNSASLNLYFSLVD